MNELHLQQIFSHYIDRFEELNNSEHLEYYKWKIIKKFRKEMDKALETPADEFPAELYRLKRLSANLIDNYTQPFHGLSKFAEKEPETVRQMFLSLYEDDGGDIKVRQAKVRSFLEQSHALRDKYYPDSYLYKDDMHSVTGYLFLYDPDHNYLFKATHAQIFADCIEFYDDWGSGNQVKLDVYYRMCDWIADEIKKSDALMATDASRFENGWGVDPDTLYPDTEKHILVFDLIYCCSTYGLFDGISFIRPKSKERQLIQGKKEKAASLYEEVQKARSQLKLLDEAKLYISDTYSIGCTVRHKTFGTGKVTELDGDRIEIDFSKVGIKKLGTYETIAKGIISSDRVGYAEKIDAYKDVLKRYKSIEKNLASAEQEMKPYIDYLE